MQLDVAPAWGRILSRQRHLLFAVGRLHGTANHPTELTSMWCPDCQDEFQAVPGSDVQVCPRCRAAARLGKRKRNVPSFDSPQTQPQSSQPKFRVDAAHSRRFVNSKQTERPRDEARSLIKRATAIGSTSHLITYGLFVFLLGQAILAWAFLTGHYTAWNIANVVSIFGITFSVAAVILAMRKLEQRVEHLARLTGRKKKQRPRRKITRRKSRPAARKSTR